MGWEKYKEEEGFHTFCVFENCLNFAREQSN